MAPRVLVVEPRFELDGSYRYLLVWFTSLPQDDDGKYRGGVADVTLRS